MTPATRRNHWNSELGHHSHVSILEPKPKPMLFPEGKKRVLTSKIGRVACLRFGAVLRSKILSSGFMTAWSGRPPSQTSMALLGTNRLENPDPLRHIDGNRM